MSKMTYEKLVEPSVFPELTWENCNEIFYESMEDLILANKIIKFVKENKEINNDVIGTIVNVDSNVPRETIVQDSLIIGMELGMRYQQKYGGVDES